MNVGAWQVNQVHCTDALTLLKGLPDGCVDLIVTSPPYDNLRTYNGYSFDFEPIAHESYRVLKDGGVLVWVVGDSVVNGSETLTSFRQALYFKDAVGFRMHDTMIWHKYPPQFGKFNRYTPSFEFMFVLSKGAPCAFTPVTSRNPNAGDLVKKRRTGVDGWGDAKNLHAVKSGTVLDNVWTIDVGFLTTSDEVSHPAMFPEQLAERHILTWSNPGDLVLDYFAGSGTTLKMARNNNRRYLGCDISTEYVELCKRRLDQPFTAPMFADVLPTVEASQVSCGTTDKAQSGSQLSLLPPLSETVETA